MRPLVGALIGFVVGGLAGLAWFLAPLFQPGATPTVVPNGGAGLVILGVIAVLFVMVGSLVGLFVGLVVGAIFCRPSDPRIPRS